MSAFAYRMGKNQIWLFGVVLDNGANCLLSCPFAKRAVSSAVEHRSYKPGVTGSNPVPPTNRLNNSQGLLRFQSLLTHTTIKKLASRRTEFRGDLLNF